MSVSSTTKCTTLRPEAVNEARICRPNQGYLHPGNEDALRLLDIFLGDCKNAAPGIVEWGEESLPEGLVVFQHAPTVLECALIIYWNA